MSGNRDDRGTDTDEDTSETGGSGSKTEATDFLREIWEGRDRGRETTD